MFLYYSKQNLKSILLDIYIYLYNYINELFLFFFYMLKIFKELLKGHKTTTTTNLIIAYY